VELDGIEMAITLRTIKIQEKVKASYFIIFHFRARDSSTRNEHSASTSGSIFNWCCGSTFKRVLWKLLFPIL
jgi:hypothetical protein